MSSMFFDVVDSMAELNRVPLIVEVLSGMFFRGAAVIWTNWLAHVVVRS